MSDIKVHSNNYTIDYYAYLAWNRNQEIAKKTDMYREAMSWKAQKYTGRADVCFELYGALKDSLNKSLPHFKQVGKAINVKPILGQDMMVTGIEYRQKGSWVTVAKNMQQIQTMGENFIVESVLLGDDNGES